MRNRAPSILGRPAAPPKSAQVPAGAIPRGEASPLGRVPEPLHASAYKRQKLQPAGSRIQKAVREGAFLSGVPALSAQGQPVCIWRGRYSRAQ